MEEKKYITVKNRDNGVVGYTIPDTGIRRDFAAGESKKIELEELKQLSYIPGGEFLLKHYFIVDDREAIQSLNLNVEPEYFYTEEDIKKILLDGTLDELEDTLNFAPEGVLDLIKKVAVEEEIPDVRKRKLITEITGFGIENAINVNHIMEEQEVEVENTAAHQKTRKVPLPISESGKPVRKVKVINAEKASK